MLGVSNTDPLWLFWGQQHMTFLRYMTLRSACAVHPDVRLVTRDEEIRPPSISWAEEQDFMFDRAGIPNWFRNALALPITRVPLDYIAPEIAAIRADDLHTADLLKWWTLATTGGTVTDMDVMFFRSLPPIEADVQTVSWPESWGIGRMPMAFIQGRPCSIWMDAYRLALANYSQNDYFSAGCTAIGFDTDQGVRLPDRIVTPWAGVEPPEKWSEFTFDSETWPAIPDECVGIHWQAGANQHWNKRTDNWQYLRPGALREVIGRIEPRGGNP